METEQQRELGKGRSLVVLFAVWLCTQFFSLFSPPLMDDVDGIHVEAAREMAARHDYVTLYVDGIRYLDKPPLPYWLGAAGVHLFGAHDWAVRLSLAVSALALTLYLYWMGTRWFNERAGFFAACAFATSLGPYIFTRFFIPDLMVALWMTIAADLILLMVRDTAHGNRIRALYPASFALVCTAAVLTKGLIGVVFPVGLLFLYLLLLGRLKDISRMRPLLGTAVFLLTALPWHILAAVRNAASGSSRGWVWFYFVNEQINRYLNKRIPRDYDKVPLLTFWVLLLVWVLPWGVFLFGAGRRLWKERASFRLGGPQRLFLLWALLILGFFTFSTRQEYYTLPAVPALALLSGTYLADDNRSGTKMGLAWVRGAFVALFGISSVVACLCLYLAVMAPKPAAGVELYEALVKHPEEYQLSFGHFFDLTTTAFGYFRLPLLGMAVSLFATTGLALWLHTRRRLYGSVLALTFGMCAVIACIHSGLTRFYPILGSEPLARAIEHHWVADAEVVLDGQYSNGSSINFYLGHPVLMLNGRVNNLWYGSLYADAPHRFETDDSFLSLWESPRPIFFVTSNRARTETWRIAHGGKVIAESAGKYVLLNHN